jgi:hypothetical protein
MTNTSPSTVTPISSTVGVSNALQLRTTMPVFNDTIHDNLLLPIVLREHAYNAVGADARKACIFQLQDDVGGTFMVFAHDGRPFPSVPSTNDDGGATCTDTLIACMSHNTSLGTSGALGNGMKYTIMVLNKSNNPRNTNLIVLSRDDNKTFIGAQAYDGSSQYVTQALSPNMVAQFIKMIDDHMDDDTTSWANVFYINRVTGFNTNKRGGILFAHHIRTVSELINSDTMDQFTGGIRIATGADPKKPGVGQTKRLVRNDAFHKDAFVTDSIGLTTSVDYKPTESEYKQYAGTYDVALQFYHHARLQCTANYNRAIPFNEGVGSSPQKFGGYPVANSLRIYSDLHPDYGNTEMQDRMHRINTDPVYLSTTRPKTLWWLMPTINHLPIVTNKADLTHAWNLAHGTKGQSIANTTVDKLSGIVTVEARITSKQEISRQPIPGGANEFFYTAKPEMLRAIVDAAIVALSKQPVPEKLRTFITNVEAYYPVQSESLWIPPLATSNRGNGFPKITVHKFVPATDNGPSKIGAAWADSKKFKPKSTNIVCLADSNGKPIKDLLTLRAGNKSVNIAPVAGSKIGAHTITIPELHKYIDDDMVPIDEDGYRDVNNASVGPRPLILVQRNGSCYKLNTKIDVPARKTRTGTNSKGGLPGWVKADPALYVLYKDVQGALYLNSFNPTIKLLFQNTHNRFDKQQTELYTFLREAAENTSVALSGKVVFKDENSSELDVDSVIINQVIGSILECHPVATHLKKKLLGEKESLDDGNAVIEALEMATGT